MRQTSSPSLSRPYFWLFVLGIIWGANFAFMKLALRTLTPDQAVWLRLAFGALTLSPFLPAALASASRNRTLLPHAAMMSLFSNVLTFHCFMEGARRLDSGVAGAVSGAIPLLTAALAGLALPQERLDRIKLAGLALGMCGVVALSAPWKQGGVPSLAGAGFMLLGALGYAAAFVYARRFLTGSELKPVELAALQMAAAVVLYAPLTGFEGMSAVFANWQAGVSVGLGLGVLGTGVAGVIHYALIRSIGAVAASAVTYLPPVVALALGALFMGESLGAGQAAGALAVLGGLFVMRNARPRTAKPETVKT